VEALLRCTHALSDYRLTLKQGEPFKPVVLRVHSDPISIIDRVLEQNPKAYTRLPEFLEMAANMVRAGITQQARSIKFDSETGDNSKELHRAEKLILKQLTLTSLAVWKHPSLVIANHARKKTRTNGPGRQP
jgi:hypothetical protein